MRTEKKQKGFRQFTSQIWMLGSEWETKTERERDWDSFATIIITTTTTTTRATSSTTTRKIVCCRTCKCTILDNLIQTSFRQAIATFYFLYVSTGVVVVAVVVIILFVVFLRLMFSTYYCCCFRLHLFTHYAQADTHIQHPRLVRTTIVLLSQLQAESFTWHFAWLGQTLDSLEITGFLGFLSIFGNM